MGAIGMLRHMAGGAGTWFYDGPGSYEAALILMLALSIAASGMTLRLRERRALRVGLCTH